MQKKVGLLILGGTIVRLFISQLTELGNAEVYYWTYTLRLQYNYYDHPPIVGWLIRLTTVNLHFQSELFIRLGAVITAAISTWLIYRIGRLLQDERAGMKAALLYTVSPYAGLMIGAYIIPDSPQLACWLGSILVLLTMILRPSAASSNRYWIGFGILAGLCVLSKLHGVFIWLGAGLYIARFRQGWFREKRFWLALLISLFISSPVLIWNLQNHFVSFAAYGKRFDPVASGKHPMLFLKAVFSIFLISNPFNVLLILGSLQALFKNKRLLAQEGLQLILYCSIPLIGCMGLLAFFMDVQPHWPGPAVSTLLLLPAIALSKPLTGPLLRPWMLPAGGIFIIAFASLTISTTMLYPGPLTQQTDGLDIGKGDPTIDEYGWTSAGRQYDTLFRNDMNQHLMPANTALLIYQWYPGAHIEYYLGRRTGQQTIRLGAIEQLGNYYWSNKYKQPLHNGDSAYLVIPSNQFDYKQFDRVVNRFRSYQLAQTLLVNRGGFLCKQYYVFRMYGYQPRIE